MVMKKLLKKILFLMVILGQSIFSAETVKLTDEASIYKVIKAMTLEEKAKLYFL